jgi:raffinose/stachyose/melibiose transport system permease protein
MQKHKKRKKYLMFITPGFILYTIFIVIPIIYVIYLSFFDWNGLTEMKFTGLSNFKLIFTDQKIAPDFWGAVRNNLKYLLCIWFIVTPLQYLTAYLFFIRIPAYKYLKFMVFMPYVISSTIVSFFATMIFNPNIGILNKILNSMGLKGGAWFGDVHWAFKLFIMIVIWQSAGSGMMIFYSNFLDIPQEVMESCSIDGANEWQRFWHILVPLSLPSCASTIIMSTIWALSVFDLPYILVGSTGGVKGVLDFVNLVFYRYTFGSVLNAQSNYGFGAAISTTMLAVIAVVTMIQNKILAKFEYEN